VEVFTHTCPLPAGGACCVEGDDPPDAFVDVDLDEVAGAEVDAEFEAGAGAVAVGFAAGVAVAAAAGAALLPEPDEPADAVAGVVSRFERDFLVVDAVLSLAGAELDAAVDDFDASAEASVDASAAFFERDFLVVPVEASADLEASAEASVEFAAAFFDRDFFVLLPLEASADFEESADASVESAAAFFDRDFFVVDPAEESVADFDASAEESADASAVFFERDFFVVPVDESEPEADESALASAVDFFFFDLEVPLADESLELALESLDASAAFFFFFAFVVVELLLESELVSCAFVAMAPTEISASTKPVPAKAIRALCHNVFMIVLPVSAACASKPLRETKLASGWELAPGELSFGLIGEAGSVSLGLFENALRHRRFERCHAAIEVPGKPGRQIRFEVVHNRVDDFLGLILRQAGLLHDHLDEFVHGA
jgi:hypothetical protein